MAASEGMEWEEEEEAAPPPQAASSGGGFITPWDDEVSSVNYHLPESGPVNKDRPPDLLKMPKRRKCPKIYFGTRTHKQVAQIVRELKKTRYAGVRMTILASREHTCIHPSVSKSFNKNQDCQDLMDKRKGGGCRFQANVKQKMASHNSVRTYLGTDTAWDLEELVKAGRKVKACPYFSVRELKNSAQLIICPYNYLVEPNIRASMDINLNNQIVILDEAHNIEDSARDAASAKFKLDDVVAAMQDCERMVEHKVLPEVHQSLAAFLSRLSNWIQRCSSEPADYTDFNSSARVMTGTVGLAQWNQMVFQPETYTEVKALLGEALKEQSAALEQNNEGFEEAASKVLLKKTTDLIGGLFTVLDFMNRKNSVYRDDYRISVVKAQEKAKGGTGKGWLGRGQGAAFVSTITLNFWCLNPGVCFDELLTCRSIILTSGTLSPMVTFASELEVRFPVTLEANHVVEKKQVWAGALGVGPSGHSLNATYHNTNSYGFQDELGALILRICSTVPHGVLVFLPSYKLLNDLTARWEATGLWAQLVGRKAVVTEPRFGDQLDNVMREFYSVISSTNNTRNELGQDGALFLAVCRGKVSEGLDFADNNARAVVCVGIPFPAVKDTLVDLKKKYNDRRKQEKPEILAGRDWYEIQAFRALNQALGRCIRHKNDWGAILMVDDRYAKNPRYVQSLSKWVRGRVINHRNCDSMLQSLSQFTHDMKELALVQEEIVPELETTAGSVKVTENRQGANVKNEGICSGDTEITMTKSSWIPKEKETLAKRIAKLKKLTDTTPEPLKENMKIVNPDKENLLDSKTHLNSGGNLNKLPNPESSCTIFDPTPTHAGLKRKRSSCDEVNFNLVDFDNDKLLHSKTHLNSGRNRDKTADTVSSSGKFNSAITTTGTKRKHSSCDEANFNLVDFDDDFDWNGKREISPPVVYDYLPTSSELTSKSSNVTKDSVLKYSALELESSEDRQLHEMLVKRRKMKEQKAAAESQVTQIPDTPEKVNDRLHAVDLNVSSSGSSATKKKSTRMPLFNQVDTDLYNEEKKSTQEVIDTFDSDEDF